MRKNMIFVVLTLAVSVVGCEAPGTSPTPTPLPFLVLDGPVTFTVDSPESFKPAAVATVSLGDKASIEFTLTCKTIGEIWGFHFLRDDGQVFAWWADGCLMTKPVREISEWTFAASSPHYNFGKGHTVGVRLVVAADAYSFYHGGPYLYSPDRDIMTWIMN